MSECRFVEKPLLNKLASMDWWVIDQGEGVPKHPAASLRSSFREVILKDTFIGKQMLSHAESYCSGDAQSVCW